jgi:hypothetical protein
MIHATQPLSTSIPDDNDRNETLNTNSHPHMADNPGTLHGLHLPWKLQTMLCLHTEVQHAESLPKNLTDEIIDGRKNEQWDDEPGENQANKQNGKQNDPHILQNALDGDG